MKHAGAAALLRVESLLHALRSVESLKERTPGVFYFKSKAFLHFHEDPAGLYADVRLRPDTGFDRLKVDDAEGQATLLTLVRGATASPGR